MLCSTGELVPPAALLVKLLALGTPSDPHLEPIPVYFIVVSPHTHYVTIEELGWATSPPWRNLHPPLGPSAKTGGCYLDLMGNGANPSPGAAEQGLPLQPLSDLESEPEPEPESELRQSHESLCSGTNKKQKLKE